MGLPRALAFSFWMRNLFRRGRLPEKRAQPLGTPHSTGAFGKFKRLPSAFEMPLTAKQRPGSLPQCGLQPRGDWAIAPSRSSAQWVCLHTQLQNCRIGRARGMDPIFGDGLYDRPWCFNHGPLATWRWSRERGRDSAGTLMESRAELRWSCIGPGTTAEKGSVAFEVGNPPTWQVCSVEACP